MSIAGREWADVRNELFGEPYMVWHDGPDFSGLREAWKAEPEALLELLFVGMGEGDGLAAQALSELEPTPTGETLDARDRDARAARGDGTSSRAGADGSDALQADG